MPKRKYIDWDSIEQLYRENILTNCDICRQYEADHLNSQVYKKTTSEAAIRKQAKAKGWKKNLAAKVKKQIKENLVRDEVRFGDSESHQMKEGLSDDEIVKCAADSGSRVIIRHREEIKRLLAFEEELLAELGDGPEKLYLANFQGKVISKKVGLTVTEKSVTLKNLAAVRAQRIGLERQAHNLEDSDCTDKTTILSADQVNKLSQSDLVKIYRDAIKS